MSLLNVEDLCIDIAHPRGTLHAVRGVSFHVEKGETLCIVGESGCGKSLTSHALLGLSPKVAKVEAAELSFDGTDLRRLKERQWRGLRGLRMSMIFQDPMTSLNPSFTIGALLQEVYLRHHKASRAEARAHAEEMLRKVGIANAGERLNQYPHQLSGGLRQRVMIAMGLICGPDLLIADEPTTALDVNIQLQILRLLQELKQDMGLGILFVTHDLGLVARFADRVAVMYAGRVVETAPVQQLFERPCHPYTRALINCIPVPGRTLPGARLGAIPGVVPSLVGPQSGCAFRDRCTHATPLCSTRLQRRRDSAEHVYECHFTPEETAA
ncbi:ABC transporter ATP-binding protein [Pseudooceanicola algae]|uniref:Oligopeptide transport ATP-binding protein OppD n=1 Tax=Pseudooceanicola algae TaxID=1537215 RepID=A0A418SCP4_9RHOB|nr:ABC transporter ATP-binding protein [Pseudooceanicola algae]QPM92268.1 Oligopeptide transport ATP-binding protein OppD [Pseudooceanicola algae]